MRFSINGYIGPDLNDFLVPTDRPVELEINSKGGEDDAAFSVAYQIMNRSDVTTIVSKGGNCYSAATIIFVAARRRLAHVSSKFVIHKVANIGSPYRWTADEHQKQADYFRRLDDRYFSFLADRCGRPVSVFEAKISDQPFSAMTAQDLGMITDLEW
jgi:ATP-dependent protease ClpP protease subunit